MALDDAMGEKQKNAVYGFGVLLAATLFFALIQLQIDRLRFVDMTWAEWLHRQIMRMM